MKCFIGIDGGGTKTAFACYDAQGACKIEFSLPSCHVLQVSKEEAIAILCEGLQKIKQVLKKEDVCYICAGLAGYGKNIDVRRKIEEICELAFKGYKYIIQNDGEIAHAGALNGNDGILMIAGTGSIALSKMNGEWSRCGGWGYMLGDEGSAYWIAKKLLQEYTMQCDGRHPRTTLVDFIKESCNLQDDYDMIRYIHETLEIRRDQIATLARINYLLAQDGDKAAIQIYKEAAKEIGKIVNTLAKKSPTTCAVSYAGGVWKANDYLIHPLKEVLHSNVQFIEPMYSPVYGAYLLALEAFSNL